MQEELDDFFIKQVEDDFPQWDDKPRETRVHDWRNHVGERIKKIWITLEHSIRLAIALDAQHLADQEEWE